MRRFIVIFMMLLLPLQWGWAAAASVCEHEAGGAHFGHHEHKHTGAGKATADKSEVPPATDLPGYHPDCHSCHGMGAACVPASPAGAPGWRDSTPPSASGKFFPDPPIQGLLRPPMPLVA
ncbi:hypothetical protein FHW64_002413 [Variovorax sp. Sphag1AA]|nr:hypothetical protein [Variovorax sp. Sphag1AA]